MGIEVSSYALSPKCLLGRSLGGSVWEASSIQCPTGNSVIISKIVDIYTIVAALGRLYIQSSEVYVALSAGSKSQIK